MSNAEHVKIPIGTKPTGKFNQHAFARDNCDALALYSLSTLRQEYDTVVITGAKWKNISNVVRSVKCNRIICFNPDFLPGDRLVEYPNVTCLPHFFD